jgi:hypothetical protein
MEILIICYVSFPIITFTSFLPYCFLVQRIIELPVETEV